MDNLSKLLADLGSWYWWLSVVVIGLAINLASSYMKPWMDSYLERWSVDRRKRSAKKQAIWQAHIQRLASDPMLIILEGVSENRCRIQGVQMLLISALCMGLVIATTAKTAISPTAVTVFWLVRILLSVLACATYATMISLHSEARQLRRNVSISTRTREVGVNAPPPQGSTE